MNNDNDLKFDNDLKSGYTPLTVSAFIFRVLNDEIGITPHFS
jgi:hypothetical protein